MLDCLLCRKIAATEGKGEPMSQHLLTPAQREFLKSVTLPPSVPPRWSWHRRVRSKLRVARRPRWHRILSILACWPFSTGAAILSPQDVPPGRCESDLLVLWHPPLLMPTDAHDPPGARRCQPESPRRCACGGTGSVVHIQRIEICLDSLERTLLAQTEARQCELIGVLHELERSLQSRGLANVRDLAERIDQVALAAMRSMAADSQAADRVVRTELTGLAGRVTEYGSHLIALNKEVGALSWQTGESRRAMRVIAARQEALLLWAGVAASGCVIGGLSAASCLLFTTRKRARSSTDDDVRTVDSQASSVAATKAAAPATAVRSPNRNPRVPSITAIAANAGASAVPRADSERLGVGSRRGQRADQQDSATVFEIRGFSCMVIADGMGGGKFGALASAAAVTAAARCLMTLLAGSGASDNPDLRTISAAAVAEAQRHIEQRAAPLGPLGTNDVRTTLIVVVQRGNELAFAYIGDGGALIHRNRTGSIEQLLNPMRPSQHTSAISGSLGPRIDGAQVTGLREVEEGDLVLAGTDGVVDAFPDPRGMAAEIRQLLMVFRGNLRIAVRFALRKWCGAQDAAGYIIEDNATLAALLVGPLHPTGSALP